MTVYSSGFWFLVSGLWYLVSGFYDGGDILLYVFIGCFAFGVFYSVVSLVLGGHGADHSIDHGGGLDIQHDGFDLQHGGLDLHHDGIDLHHDAVAHADHGGDSADSPSPFSPIVIASAITAFGAVGLISMKGFGMSSLISTVVALAFAGVIGVAIFFGIVKFMYGSQSNSVFSLEDLVDTEAEVITPIPVMGLGEIAYVANGIRYTMPARATEGESIKRGAVVIIRKIAGSEAIVQRKLTLDDIDLYSSGYENEGVEKPRSDAGNK